MVLDKLRTGALVLTVLMGGFCCVADAAFIELSPGDMPAWDANLLFLGYGAEEGFNNDTVRSVAEMADSSGFVRIGKSPARSDFVYTGLGGVEGTWEYTASDYAVEYLAVRAGNKQRFALFELKDTHNGSSGLWSTENLTDKKGAQPDLLHLSFYGRRTLHSPEPGTTAALASLALVGLCAYVRRRRRHRSPA